MYIQDNTTKRNRLFQQPQLWHYKVPHPFQWLLSFAQHEKPRIPLEDSAFECILPTGGLYCTFPLDLR